jgi:hypothetical protein
VTLSATVSLTVKVATPLALVVAGEPVIVEEPEPAASETDLPETGLPFVSFSVTVIVEVLVPFAVTEPGLALTVDLEALAVVSAGLMETMTAVQSELVSVAVFAEIVPAVACARS